jgi:hypothetical protein
VTYRAIAGSRTRTVAAITAVAALLVVAVGALFLARNDGEASATPQGRPLLPDLAMAPPTEIYGSLTEDGRGLILFSAEIVNTGEAELLVEAERGDSGGWRITQRIPYSVSGAATWDVAASLSWGGDGHDHWHVLHAARYRLVPLDDDGRELAGEPQLDQKAGFCFFDRDEYRTSLPGAPAAGVHTTDACGTIASDRVSMGLSVGWGDTYVWHLPGQSIDITGLPGGRYRLVTTVNEDGSFQELTRDNNKSWVDVMLSTDADGVPLVEVVATGPRP